MANVVVMRRHVTGNVTGGFYLIDLMCLGVKDTRYYFNIPETEANEMFDIPENKLTEIDYQLAHNIIYAGHDFAMEFDIPPHKDFALTKMILEEDNDEVPLVDIPTGDYDGKPHLVINPLGEGTWALQKLKENAGEGNYYYSDSSSGYLGGDDFDDERDFDDDDDEKDEVAKIALEQIPRGAVSAYVAKMIKMEDLFDEKNLKEREVDEAITLLLEGAIRLCETAPELNIMSNEAVYDTEAYNTLDTDNDQLNSTAGPIFIDELDEDGDIEKVISGLASVKGSLLSEPAEALMEKYPGNLFLLTELYSLAGFEGNIDLQNSISRKLESISGQYPYAALYVALNNKINEQPLGEHYEKIMQAASIREAFPEYTSFGLDEHFCFWVLKIWYAAKQNDVAACIFYYKLVRECGIRDYLLVRAQTALGDLLNRMLSEKY